LVILRMVVPAPTPGNTEGTASAGICKTLGLVTLRMVVPDPPSLPLEYGRDSLSWSMQNPWLCHPEDGCARPPWNTEGTASAGEYKIPWFGRPEFGCSRPNGIWNRQTRLEHAKLLNLVNLRAVVPNPPRPQNAEGTALIRPFLLNLDPESTSPIWILI
jgi:hypothetical protein